MHVRLMPTRHSPFYSPFLALHAAGFLKQEGIESTLRLPAGGESAGALLRKGEVDVIQSAVSAAWAAMEKHAGAAQGASASPAIPVHFAQINQRDGFVLVGREPEPDFEWKNLEGKALIADHGHQPLLMLRWAAHNKGADFSKIKLIDAGPPLEMETAFRLGQGDYVHLQAGVPQHMARMGEGHIVASVGAGLKPLAFSSISAMRGFIEGDAIEPFLRAFGRAKRWTQESDAAEVARTLAPLFPALDEESVRAAVADCQKLGCWEGGTAIPRDAYEEAQKVFLWAGGIQRAHAYESVCWAGA
jgi:NitT/TauT family transport system substrate-binding protein